MDTEAMEFGVYIGDGDGSHGSSWEAMDFHTDLPMIVHLQGDETRSREVGLVINTINVNPGLINP